MEANTATAGTAHAPSPATITYTVEQVRELEAALENPFDPSEIKWRVTNTSSDRRRGQVIAYADPRSYTDRLNALFTVRGWTREYAVQVIQNFERRDRGNGESTISGKIVVTCKMTIDGLGSHSGLGEEWADNENAGTSAEAQAFKRACSCFGLGRYLYDLGGNWVDLDERRQPLSKPRLPDWALPKRKSAITGSQNGNALTATNGHVPHKGVAPGDLRTLKDRVKALCDQVGFGLARSVTKAVAATEDPETISDVVLLSALSAKLEDTLRGVERLRKAAGVVGQASFSRLCRQMNLPGDSLDDIPSRSTLRQLVDALERVTDATNAGFNGRPGTSAKWTVPEDVKAFGAARADLIRAALRVGRQRNMKVSDVVDRAAKGAFRFADLRTLTPEALPALKEAIEVLRQLC